MATRGSFARAAACALVAICALATAGLDGQAPQMFQFIIGATDASGMPVTDLRPEEILMSENDMPAKVVKVEPYAVPVKLTVAVDNGVDSRDALAHYRMD